MATISDDVLKKAETLQDEARRPFPASRKIHVQGSRADLRVGMREVTQDDTPGTFGVEKNPPITIYDTSGPYTDPDAPIDLHAGLAPVRQAWIEERADSEGLDGPTSEYGRKRLRDPELARLRFPRQRPPRRARDGVNVTQMHYARRGMVTPEMEYVAIRENQRIDELEDQRLLRRHPGQAFGAPGDPAPAGQPHGSALAPPNPTTQPGTVVEGVWPASASIVGHDVKLTSGPKGVRNGQSGPASSGYRYKRTLKKPGKYTIICTLHEEMKMTIKVSG